MSHEPVSDSWVVYEFADRYLGDLEQGRTRTLEQYLELYPGHESAIRREHGELASVHEPDESNASTRPARFVGHYRLLSELGRGGQARVWLCEHTKLGRKVALKVLGAPLVGTSQGRRDRFRREAELVARLEHPGICGVLEADLDAELPWIAMRYVEGETLAALLAREREELERARAAGISHPLRGARLAERLLFFERTARALHAAHEAGVVHRDVKPGNIMVASDGAPVVLDFGLAYDESEQQSITRTGEVFGTPAYMAPEQLDGRTADRRTDIYGLGVVVYEAVTGVRPHAGVSSEALSRAIRSELPRDPLALNPRLPRDLAVVLFTALEKEPSRRYATALEFAEELRRVREYEPIVARPVGIFGRLVRWARRHPAVAATTSGAILILSLALITALFFIEELRTQRNAKEKALVDKQAALDLYEGAWFRDLSTSRVQVNPTEGLRLAIAAAERDPGLASNCALLAALAELRERASLSGHTDQITQGDVSTANARIATCAFDGTARIWDASKGETLATLRGHKGKVWCVRFDPSGERVVTASEDGTARVWTWTNPSAAPILLTGHAGEVEWAEFSSDGAHIVTASRDHTARIWNSRSGALEHELIGHAGNVSIARFFAGDRLVVTASGEPPSGSPQPEGDNSLRIFDASTGKSVALAAEHTDSVRRVVFHPDGRRFLSTSDDTTARLWDLDRIQDGKLASSHMYQLQGYASSASFHPDGKRLALASESGARVVDVDTGKTLYDLPDHDHRSIIDIAYEPHGLYLATAAFDNTIRVFSGSGPEQVALCHTVQVRPRGVHWAPDGSWLVSWHTTPEAKVWYGHARPFLVELAPAAGALATARFDPRGKRIVTACADGRAAIFDAASGELVQHLDPAPAQSPRSALRSADYDANGERVLAAAADGTITVFRTRDGGIEHVFHSAPEAPPPLFLQGGEQLLFLARSGEPVIASLGSYTEQHLRGVHGHVIALRATADGTRIACGTDGRTVHLWRLDGTVADSERECAWTFGPFEDPNHKLNSVYDVALSADGRRLAATTQNLRTILFDADDGRVLGEDRAATVGKLAFTPDGKYLAATGKWSGFMLGYRTSDDAGRPTLERLPLRDLGAWQKTASFFCLASAPSRDLVVAGSLDRTAKLWDLERGECLAIYTGHTDAVWDLDISPDGASFVTASGDGTARIWPIDVLAQARAAKPAGAGKENELPRPTPRKP